MTKYLAWDIETAKITPEGDDLQNHRPLGICCWAIAWMNQRGETRDTRGYGMYHNGSYRPQLTRSECCLLVARLHRAVEQGYTILTHNGVGFDFDILAEESGMHAECAELAMNSVDTCLQVHCMKGFPIGLEAICKGMGLQGKTEGMNGSLAPVMWQEGKYDEVMAYVAQDVRCTLEVALEIERRGSLSWIAKSGRLNHLAMPRLLPVFEAMQLPEPDTSWMQSPIPRSRFTDWLHDLADRQRIEAQR